MIRSNDSLANGLAYLVQKIVHKSSEARDYSPNTLASILCDTLKTTRSSVEVIIPTFLAPRIARFNTL